MIVLYSISCHLNLFFTSPLHNTLRLFLTPQGKVLANIKMQVRIERYIANNLMKLNVFSSYQKQYFHFCKYDLTMEFIFCSHIDTHQEKTINLNLIEIIKLNLV